MKKIVLMSVFSLIFITGCDIYGGGLIVDTSYSHGYNNAPPAHARAHGRRAHRYHYYPNAEFYFDTGSNMYYFLDSNLQWTFSVNLPIHLRHHLHNNYVEIEMDEARPYTRHKYYKNKYRKDNSKYKSKHKYDSRNLNGGTRYNSKHKYDSRTLDDGSRYKSKHKYDSRTLDDGSRHKSKHKYDSRTLDDGSRHKSKHKYDAKSLNNGSRHKSRDKKKAKKPSKKYREDDERGHSKDKKNKQNKHGLHE